VRPASAFVLLLRRRPPEEEGGARLRDGQKIQRKALHRSSRSNSNGKICSEDHAQSVRDIPFNRLSAPIVEAVREAKGEAAAQLIEYLKKGEMAERAQELLAGSGWIPEPLRTPGRATDSTSLASKSSQISTSCSAGEESAATGCETAMGDSEAPAEDVLVLAEQQPVAAE